MTLDYCEDSDYIVKNPMRRMKAPQPAEPKERVFAWTEVVAMLKAVEGTRWEAAFWVLATTGMRVSEVLGLEWKNIDLDTGHVRIEHRTGRIYGRPGVSLGELKTRASKRDVIIPPIVCDILRWHADKQRLERKTIPNPEALEDHGTVFATPAGGLYFRSQLTDVYRQIAADLRITGGSLHTFRHTVVILVQEGGHTLEDAQTLVGHATDRMTSRICSHRSTDGMQCIADAMQLMLDGAHTPVSEDRLTDEAASWNTLMGRPMGQTVPTTA
jgi:integrase